MLGADTWIVVGYCAASLCTASLAVLVHAPSKLIRERNFAVDPLLSRTDLDSSAPLVQLQSSPFRFSLVVLKKPSNETIPASQEMASGLESGNNNPSTQNNLEDKGASRSCKSKGIRSPTVLPNNKDSCQHVLRQSHY